MWLVQLDGSKEGIDYEFIFAKLVSFTEQKTKATAHETDEDKIKWFYTAIVLMDNGVTLRLPMNEGLYNRYYSRYCDEDGQILPNHNPGEIKISFNVKLATKNGQLETEKRNGKTYPKKIISQVEYSEVALEEVAE